MKRSPFILILSLFEKALQRKEKERREERKKRKRQRKMERRERNVPLLSQF